MADKFTVTLEITPDGKGEFDLIQSFKFSKNHSDEFNYACVYFYKALSAFIQKELDQSAKIYSDLS